MTTIGNNSSKIIQRTRDAFFSTETENVLISKYGNVKLDYLKELLTKSEKARQYYKKFIQMDAEILYKEVEKRIAKIEQCQVNEKDLKQLEDEICLLLGAIEDLHQEILRELVPSHEDKQEYTR